MTLKQTAAAALPVIAIAIFLLHADWKPGSASQPKQEPMDRNPEESDFEPVRNNPENLRIAAGAASGNASIMQEIRASIEANLPRNLLSGPQGELKRYLSDPDRPRIPALPGIAGFDIQKCAGLQNCLSDYLAQEPDDPTWSRTMKGSIYGEMANRFSRGVAQIHVVCRQCTCGLLIPNPERTNGLSTAVIAGELAEALGFPVYSAASRSGFQAMYFTRSTEITSPVMVQ